MDVSRGNGSPRSSFLTVLLVLAMVAGPAALTLHRVRVPAVVDAAYPNPSPYGYTVSLLLFIVPIVVILWWLVPQDRIKISKRSFLITLALTVPLGAGLDFFFAHRFLTFPNPGATLGIRAPALGGGVPVEEYVFYLTGYMMVLLLYIWLDEYWLSAYGVPSTDPTRTNFERLLRFHPKSVALAVVLIAAALICRSVYDHHHGVSGFPGYFVFQVVGVLAPATALFPSAAPVVNWRALSLEMFVILLTSLLWEATLAVPYGWWGYQPGQMMGIFITAWSYLPIEAVCVWVAVSFQTVMVYEVVKRWKASGKKARHAFLGQPSRML